MAFLSISPKPKPGSLKLSNPISSHWIGLFFQIHKTSSAESSEPAKELAWSPPLTGHLASVLSRDGLCQRRSLEIIRAGQDGLDLQDLVYYGSCKWAGRMVMVLYCMVGVWWWVCSLEAKRCLVARTDLWSTSGLSGQTQDAFCLLFNFKNCGLQKVYD